MVFSDNLEWQPRHTERFEKRPWFNVLLVFELIHIWLLPGRSSGATTTALSSKTISPGSMSLVATMNLPTSAFSETLQSAEGFN